MRVPLTVFSLAALSLTFPAIGPARAVVAAPASEDTAEIAERTHVLADTTVVTGHRRSGSGGLKLRSSFVSRIDVALERGSGEVLADLLERTVGLSVQRYGGPGALATVSIRGADPGEIEVFLDHVPLRSASRGLVDLSALQLASIEACEVYRSAPPADLGGEFAGAAVRLVSRKGGPSQLSWRTDGGSFGTWQHEATLSGSYRSNRYFLAASRFQTKGNFAFHDDNGTDHNSADDQWRSWSNGDVRRESIMGRLTQTVGRIGTADLSTQLWRSDQGLAGNDHQPTVHSRLQSSGVLHRLEWVPARRMLPVRTTLFGFLNQEELHYRDPDRELSVPGASATSADQQLDRWGYGLKARRPLRIPSLPAVGLHSFELLAERRHERLRNLPPPGRTEEDRRERTSVVFSAGDRFEVLQGRLHFDLFYRWNQVKDNYSGANPYQPFTSQPKQTTRAHGARIGLRASAGKGHVFRANYADQARFPTFVELFGYAGTIRSNPRLKPETGWRADLGWQWDWPVRPLGLHIRTEQTVYTSRHEQMIVLIRISDRETKPMNLDQARLTGAEFSWTCDHLPLLDRWKPLGWLTDRVGGILGRQTFFADEPPPASSFSGHLVWQTTRDEGSAQLYNGKELTYRPPWQLQLRADWPQNAWRLGYVVSFRDEAYWSRSNLPAYRTEAAWLHELQLRWKARAGTTLLLRIENLYNAASEDVRGYPLPGRSWFGGVELDVLRVFHPGQESTS